MRPTTGQTDWRRLPAVHTVVMTLALAACARASRAGQDPRILLGVDNAGWHGSTALVVPDGSELVDLPPATPALQPAAQRWPLLRDVVGHRAFATVDLLQATLVERCLQRADQRDIVQHTTNFHGLPTA